MKFSATRETLLPALRRASAVAKGGTLPILGHVLLDLSADDLTATGTDMEIQLQSTAPVDVARRGRITVEARKLADLVAKLPEKAILTFSVDGERAELKAGRSHFKLNTLPAENFPEFSVAPGTLAATVAAKTLREALARTLHAVALKDVRFYLNGAQIALEKDVLRVVASDGHRLALYEATAPDCAATWLGIVPRLAIVELGKLLKDYQGEVALRLSPNALYAQIGPVEFATKLVDGRFPDYQRVIPKAPPRAVTIQRADLLAVVDRVAMLANSEFPTISIAVADGEMTLAAQDKAGEESRETLDCTLDGEEFQVGFNANYVLAALGEFQGPTILWRFTQELNSSLMTDPNDAALRAVLMPVRL